MVCDAFRGHKRISKLHLPVASFSKASVQSFADLLESDAPLKEVYILSRSGAMSFELLEILANGVIGNTRLEHLHLNALGRTLEEDSVSLIKDMIRQSHLKMFSFKCDPATRADIDETLQIPLENREIPIKSRTKSAMKR